jgi:hypothetical protein
MMLGIQGLEVKAGKSGKKVRVFCMGAYVCGLVGFCGPAAAADDAWHSGTGGEDRAEWAEGESPVAVGVSVACLLPGNMCAWHSWLSSQLRGCVQL